MDPRAGLDAFREDEVSYICRDPNPEPPSQCRRICFRAILIFPALKQNLASHEFKGDRRVKHDFDTVEVTQETVWRQQGAGKFVPRCDKCFSFGADRVQSRGIAVQLNVNCSY